MKKYSGTETTSMISGPVVGYNFRNVEPNGRQQVKVDCLSHIRSSFKTELFAEINRILYHDPRTI
jgi:hypothetical protein